MAVGLLSARVTRANLDFSRLSIILLAIACILAWIGLTFYQSFSHINIDVGGQASPQQFFFGTEYRANDPSAISIPVEAIAGLFFLLLACVFIGPGQIMGRAFDAIPNRISAYTADIAGSISGIVAFGLCSYFQLPPLVWFVVSLALLGWLIKADEAVRGDVKKPSLLQSSVQLVAALVVLAAVVLPEPAPKKVSEIFWSPYYKIEYMPDHRGIYTNNIGHQEMRNIGTEGSAYRLPHLLNRDAGRKPFEDVLIIGAGSGNDVQGARLFGAKNIDAVEIDPVIQSLGMREHPNRPYDDPQVKRYNDDGRSFVKKTDKKYDLAVYALVDSLVLHSGYSSLRLESFLFTREAMQDIKARLKPDGVFAMYNYYRQGWVVERLVKTGEEVFGSKPLVISLPYRETIGANDNVFGAYTFILCGNTQGIEKAFASHQNFWLNQQPKYNFNRNSFAPSSPSGTDAAWSRIAPARIDTSTATNLPTDNWPFLYLRDATVPGLNLRGMLVVGVLSLALLWLVGVRSWHTTPLKTGVQQENKPTVNWRVFNWQMFFLGAGFMLLETKGVVHMALLFGSTWIVNSFVFGAILVMILLANLWVAKTKPKSLALFYGLLIVSLLIGVLIPMSSFLALPGTLKVVASCAITFIPVYFAGVIFSSAFRESKQPDVDFGCNIAGIILGGLLENFSLMIGFNGLLGLAMVLYALSFFLRPKPMTTE